MKGQELTQFAIELIADERKRQIEEKKFSIVNDNSYHYGQLADAAACYAMTSGVRYSVGALKYIFPWIKECFKPAQDNAPQNRIRELVKAGALIVAEIERLQREAANNS